MHQQADPGTLLALSSREQAVPTLDTPRSARPRLSNFRPAHFPDHPWPARCIAQHHMRNGIAIAALFASTLAASAAGRIAPLPRDANELISAGRYQLAVEALVQILHDTRVPEQEDENRAALTSNLGLAYEKLGRYGEAEATLGKALQIYKDLGLTESLNYARALNNMANVYLNQKRYAKAEETFKNALALYRTHFSEVELDIALVLNNLGLTRLMTGDNIQAERYFRDSLDLQRKLKDETNRMAVTLNNLALVCKKERRFEEAARIYAQAIEVWRASSGPAHPEVAVGLENLASLESAMGQDANAETHYQEALSILDATMPPEHPNRTAAMTGYAELLAKIGRKREAKQLQARARSLRTQHDHENFQDLTVDVRRLQP